MPLQQHAAYSLAADNIKESIAELHLTSQFALSIVVVVV